LKPLQGEGGIVPATTDYLQAARALCNKHDLLLFLDEIQCGMGRTGKLWAYEHAGIKPDVMSMWPKPLAAVFRLGPVWPPRHAANGNDHYGSHGTTYGGNPLAMAVAEEALGHDYRAGTSWSIRQHRFSAYAFERFNQSG
jgi:acetylornithine/succinyldiaminopimelate/putrescine aminotransferase